jgi:CubicO group peptidase (beta-lactamase class C family)
MGNANHNIPAGADQFISSVFGAGGTVSVIAFTPTGGWVGVAANGQYAAQGIPQDCFVALGNFINNGLTVRSIAFPPAGGWVIVADQNYQASGIPDDCFKMIGTFRNNGWPITCVAFPPSGGNSWVIVGPNSFNASNINDECFQFLNNYMQGVDRATQVTFTPGGGWIVYGGLFFYARNIDNGCFQQMVSFANAGWRIGHVAFTPGGGYSIVCNAKKPAGADNPMRGFESYFFQDVAAQWHSIWDRMKHYGVPGAGVALVANNAVAWRGSYGVLRAGQPSYVYPDTAFQAASISKPHAAVGILRLVQEGTGNVQLTDPIANHTSWKVATRACAPSAWAQGATVQLTLQHKGGFVGRDNTYPSNVCSNFTGGGGGFGGYPAGSSIPMLDQILAGASPANSPKIEITTKPGTFFYSGMGFMVLMRMLQDVTGQDFRTWMQQHVLGPAGMTQSTFAIALPPQLARAAAGHDAGTGQPIPGLRNQYPEAPAAGLYTNAGDLGRFIVMLNQAGAIDGQQVISAQLAKAMLAQQLGIFTGGQPTDNGFVYWHNGENYGFTSLIQGYPNLHAGFAIMLNLDDGQKNASNFYNEAAGALKRIYGLP